MNQEIIINSKLEQEIQSIIDSSVQGVLLTGREGSGKKTLIDYIANQLTTKKVSSVIIPIELPQDKKSIGVDAIKNIKNILRTKDNSYRIFTIKEADLLTSEAQNALLKMLEEPPANVIFLLSTSKPQKILITIKSRVINLQYIRPEETKIYEFAKTYHTSFEDIAKYLTLSDGRIGLLAGLIKGDNSQLISNIDTAKDILSESPNDRLLRVDTVAKDPVMMTGVLYALQLVCLAATKATAKNNKKYKDWLRRLEEVNHTLELVNVNISAKLLLTKLFIVL